MIYTNKAVAIAGGWAELQAFNESVSLKQDEVVAFYMALVEGDDPVFAAHCSAQDAVSYCWENALVP